MLFLNLDSWNHLEVLLLFQFPYCITTFQQELLEAISGLVVEFPKLMVYPSLRNLHWIPLAWTITIQFPTSSFHERWWNKLLWCSFRGFWLEWINWTLFSWFLVQYGRDKDVLAAPVDNIWWKWNGGSESTLAFLDLLVLSISSTMVSFWAGCGSWDWLVQSCIDSSPFFKASPN